MQFTVDSDATGAVPNRQHSAEPLRHPGCGSHPRARWYCVQTKQGEEARAWMELDNQGFGTMLPLVIGKQGGKPGTVPAFPGYMFTKFDVRADRWRCIHSTGGVRRLLSSSAERPTPMPDAVMDFMQAEGFDRPLVCDLPVQLSALLPGQALKITEGPFCGLDGECLWSAGDRVRLLFAIFGRSSEIELPRRQVRAR